MRTILVSSTEAYTGKTGICLALLDILKSRGLSIGYFKPYGTMPTTVDGVVTDQDVPYINSLVSSPAPIEDVCPVVRTRGFIESFMSGRAGDIPSRVKEAFGRVSAGRDVVLIEGPADVFQGSAIGLSACDISDLLQARALVVTRPSAIEFPDALLGACGCLGERLGGALFNWVQPAHSDFVKGNVVPFLDSRGVKVFGMLPQDPVLASVTVQEIVDALHGTVLSAEDRLDEPVESFMIGAMGQEKALRFFRRQAKKAVVTGGDRADVQLAALETDTRCIILTGNLPPSSLVLARADEIGVPMILVDMDTIAAIERLEALMGRTRLHDQAKAARIRESFEKNADVDALLRAFGLE